MIENDILRKLDEIRVQRPSDQIEISNPMSFRLVGRGHQGAVFQIDEKRCVKIYFHKEDLRRELHALKIGDKVGICPKVYFWGENYIVMDYFGVPSLFDYLQQLPLTKEFTARIIDLLDRFENVGFTRYDHSARHIFVFPDNLKIIDVVHIIKDQPVYLAERLISDMGKQGDDFVHFVKEISPKWYQRWVNHPDFETVIEKARGRI